MRLLAVVVITVGCGRIAFDPIADGGSANEDGMGLQTCGSTELCNGIDDTCDDVVDEGCPCTPYSIDTGATGVGGAYTGTGAFALLRNTDTMLRRYDGAGVAQGSDTVLFPGTPTIIGTTWTGTDLVVLIQQGMTLLLSQVDETGTASAMVPIATDNGSSNIWLASRGREMAVVTTTGNNYWIQWLDDLGTPLSPRLPLSEVHSTALWDVIITSRHDGWAVGWNDYHMATDGNNHTHVAFFDNSYRLLTTYDLGGNTTDVGLTRTGNGYALLSPLDSLANPPSLALYDPVGAIMFGPTPLNATGTNALDAKIAWTGSQLRGAWSGSVGVGSGIQMITAQIGLDASVSNVETLSVNIQVGGGSLTTRAITSASGRAWIRWDHGAGGNPPTQRLTQRCP